MSNNFRKYGGINRNARIQNVKTDKIYTNILNAKNLQITNTEILDLIVDDTLTLKDEIIFNNVSQPSLTQHMGRIVGIQDATIGQEREGLIIESANTNHPGITNQYIKFAKYGSNGDNPLMIWDLSAHNVGINLDNNLPQTKLHIRGSSGSTEELFRIENGTFGNESTLSVGINQVGSQPGDNAYLKMRDGYGIERVNINLIGDSYLNTAGNIGIGTTTPQARLDVNGNIRLSGSLPYINSSANTIRLRPTFTTGETNSTSSWFQFQRNTNTSNGDNIMDFIIDPCYNEIRSRASKSLVLNGNSGGNVGINVTTPQSELHIEGSLQINTKYQDGGYIFSDYNTYGVADGEVLVIGDFDDRTGIAFLQTAEQNTTTIRSLNGNLEIVKGDVSFNGVDYIGENYTPLLTINNEGKTVFGQQQDVRSLVTVNGNNTTLYAPNSDPLDSARILTVNNATNDLSENIFTTIGFNISQDVSHTNNDGIGSGRALGDIRFIRNDTLGLDTQFVFSSYGEIPNSYKDLMTLRHDASGNIRAGIGNTLPQATLHIKTDDTQYSTTMIENTYTGIQGITTLLLQGHGPVNTTLSLEPTNTSYGSMTLKAQDTHNRFVYREKNLQFDVNDAGTNTMTLTTGGNVGIDTTTPQAKLDVNGTMRVSGVTTMTNRLNVLNNVGIGTSDPSFQLHVVAQSYARMCLQSLTGQDRIQQDLIFKTHQSGRGGGIFWQDTTDASRNSFFGRPYNDGSPTSGIIYNSTTTAEQIIGSRAGLVQDGPYREPMLSIIDNTGNVGIGIGTPQERLDVAGNIQSNKLLNKSTIHTINYTDLSFVDNLSIRTYETTNHNEYCLHIHSNRPIYVNKSTPSDVSFTIDFQLLDYTNNAIFRSSSFPPTADILVYLSEYSSDSPNNGRIRGQTNAQFIYTVNLGNVANGSDPTKDISYAPIAIQNIESTLFSNVYIETSSTYDATHWISKNVLHYTRSPTAGQYGDIQIQFRLKHNPFSNGKTNPNITLNTDTTSIEFYEA